MSYTINFENEDRGVVVTQKGIVSIQEILTASKSIYSQDSLHQLRYQIWDYTDADRLNISSDEVQHIVYQTEIEADKYPNMIVALVGTSQFFSGLDRIFKISTKVWSGFDSNTFLTQSEAREWVARTYPDLER